MTKKRHQDSPCLFTVNLTEAAHDHYLKGQTHTSHSLYCFITFVYVCVLPLIWCVIYESESDSNEFLQVWRQQLQIFLWMLLFNVKVLCFSLSVVLSSASQTVSPEISWDDRQISGCMIISGTSTETNPLWPSRRWGKPVFLNQSIKGKSWLKKI